MAKHKLTKIEEKIMLFTFSIFKVKIWRYETRRKNWGKKEGKSF